MSLTRKRRGNSRFFLLFIFIAAVLFALSLGVTHSLRNVELFNISDFEIKGNVNLADEFLTDLISDFEGQNIFSISKREIQSRFENLVRIKKVKVIKILPGKIQIKINERIASYNLKTRNGQVIPIDDEFVILDNNQFYPFEDIPIIEIDVKSEDLKIGETLANENIKKIVTFHQSILELKPDLLNEISEYYICNDEIYFVDLETGCKIVFGEENLDTKMERLIFIKDNKGFAQNTILDLRYNNQVIIRPEDE